MKKSIAALGMVAAVMGLGAAQAPINQTGTSLATQTIDAIAQQQATTVIKNHRRLSDPKTRKRRGSGMRPKEYGQWLQQSGRQKWDKRKA